MQTSAGEKGRICDTKVNQHHGYFNLKGASKKSYFYWMFEAHNKPETAPLVMWLTGGPGCSSEIALFTENGPCSVNKNGRTTSANKHSWNKDVNMLYIDQPAGTGFSYGETDTSEAQVSSDLSHFMQEFVKKYPKFHNNDFYIFGESYAGHFVPATAHKIMSMNHARNSGEYIALKGAAIGNGQTNPLEQYKYYAEMARHPSHGPHAEDIPPAISEGTYETMKAAQPGCIRLIKGCQTHSSMCSEAFRTCNGALLAPVQETGVNVYNMKKQCGSHALCADYSHVTKFLNSDKVTNVLKTHKKWSTCNMNINSMFSTDWMKNMAVHIPPMLHNGNRIMIYAGDLDFICNWRGNKAWTLQMPWNGHKGFNNAKDREWHLDGQSKASRLLQEGAQSESKSSPVGFERRYQNLQFVRIRNAGHMVPGDQPEVAQAMMQRFVAKKFLVYPEDSATDY
jgi:cathepsin A (carboxypeptidase C)